MALILHSQKEIGANGGGFLVTYESQCCDCGLPCLGLGCPYYSVKTLYCDECQEGVETLYKYDQEELCIDCIEKRLEKVQRQGGKKCQKQQKTTVREYSENGKLMKETITEIAETQQINSITASTHPSSTSFKPFVPDRVTH